MVYRTFFNRLPTLFLIDLLNGKTYMHFEHRKLNVSHCRLYDIMEIFETAKIIKTTGKGVRGRKRWVELTKDGRELAIMIRDIVLGIEEEYQTI